MNSKKPAVPGPNPTLKPISSRKSTTLKPTLTDSNNRPKIQPKLASNKAITKAFEAVKKKEWSTKKGIEYDGPLDDDQPQLEQDLYFQGQLQRAIKNELTKEKAPTQVPKSQVILPKLNKTEMEGNNQKSLKMLEKQMDQEMSKMMMDQMEKY